MKDVVKPAGLVAPAACLLFLLFAPDPQAKVTETFDLDTYEVDQDNDETLLQAIDRESPIRVRGRIYHGFTKWFIRWNYGWREDARGTCRIIRVTTSLDIDMTLPELDDATPEAAAEFRRYIRSLRLHEDGHRDIARAAAERIDAGILALRPMSGCDALSRTANRFGQGVLTETRAIERQYDASSEHGCTQGACLHGGGAAGTRPVDGMGVEHHGHRRPGPDACRAVSAVGKWRQTDVFISQATGKQPSYPPHIRS